MSTAPSSPRLDVMQEIRFAVVMYGGVSLAIYINGVAQELLRMVRATAPPQRDGTYVRPLPPEPAGVPLDTERVYRKLAYLLADERLLTRYRDYVKTGIAGPDPVEERLAAGDPIEIRFVVDILSGTSAGGINAVYLAKAIANGQSIDQLKGLWVTEGDIGQLLNDGRSVEVGRDVPLRNPPLSLLNSRRMYVRLLDALDEMDDGARDRDPFSSPYVEELDLFITATDIEGVPLPLQLMDRVVYERRHRNVFHFRYATAQAAAVDRNDFEADNNPFLAFASRCTSSFPFAFDPMRLCDIDDVLHASPLYRDAHCDSKSERWQRFFKKSLNPRTGKAQLEFPERSFGDGGYLDNKPFSYATETLQRRQAAVPVDRKLLYIEPSPEHPEDEPAGTDRPDALANVKAAVLDLPRYETIREDLQEVLHRNRMIGRVNRITELIEQDIEVYESRGSERTARPQLEDNEWDRLDLAGMVEKYSIYYLPYRRLRIAEVTDDLAELLAHISDFRDSDYLLALRAMVQIWRRENYGELADADGKPSTINLFLRDFDFAYRARRLHFLRGRIDQIYQLVRETGEQAAEDRAAGSEKERVGAEKRVVERLARHGINLRELTPEERHEIKRFLALLKCELNEVYKTLREAGRRIRSRESAEGTGASGDGAGAAAGQERATSFAERVAALGIGSIHLRYVLDGTYRDEQVGGAEELEIVTGGFASRAEEECRARARLLLREPERLPPGLRPPPDLLEKLSAAAATLSDALSGTFREVSARARATLDPDREFTPGEACAEWIGQTSVAPEHVRAIRGYLWKYYDNFDDYDQIRFPILYDTDVGEADITEIVRVSPEDATALIDEPRERSKPRPQRRQKLAGTSLMNFGAFLERGWRENDVMWGRLDGAERLITTLLPQAEDREVRTRLIAEAQTAILRSDLPDERLRKESIARGGPTDPELLGYMATRYDVERNLPPTFVVPLAHRASRITRSVFKSIARSNGKGSPLLRAGARLGQRVAGLTVVVTAVASVGLMIKGLVRRK